MEKGISYLNRDFKDYRNSLLNYTKQYYTELDGEFNDASIGAWLVDLVANIGDNLSYHIDRVYQETNLESAQEKSSVYSIARNNGVKIPGPKASMAEVEFSCIIPVTNNSGNSTISPDWSYAPCIKKGTKMVSGNDVFELLYDVDFNEQFNEDGISNRTIIPKRNSNGNIDGYTINKTGIISAGETKVFTKVIKSEDITPFMSVLLPDTNIMNIESIIFKPGTNYRSTPTLTEFYQDKEYITGKGDCNEDVVLHRFFEVEYLAQQYRWGDYLENRSVSYIVNNVNPVTESDETNNSATYVKQGEWIPLRQKFITEYTDNGYLKIIFGSGTDYVTSCSNDYAHLISHVINNDGLGVLPPSETTMYVLYRKGGGASTNKAEGAINTITYLNVVLRGSDMVKKNDVKRSISGINITPSVSGRDMPSVDEIKYLIKYYNGAQNRCVTIKDYHDRISKMPPRYGCPFRYSASEENNKIMIYVLGLDENGKLTKVLPEILCNNMVNYLSEYKMINDYVEIKPGRIINLQFEVDMFVDKNYNTSDVVTNVINCIKNYMSINKLHMGDDIFVGDIEKEVSKIDGVLNLIEMRVYNIYDNNYSKEMTRQQIKTTENCVMNEEIDTVGMEENRSCIDLRASDKMLYTDNDTMFEIRYPEQDIICKVKTR